MHTCFTISQAIGGSGGESAGSSPPTAAERIIGANPGASCSGPAYELAMMLDTLLRRQRRRHLFDLHFVTPEPFLGHFGVNGIGNMSRMMEDEFRSRHLNWTTDAALDECRAGQGDPGRRHRATARPRHPHPRLLRRPGGARRGGLGNPRGFIPTDRQLRSTRLPQHLRRRGLGGDRSSGARPPCRSPCPRPAICPRRWRPGRRRTSRPRSRARRAGRRPVPAGDLRRRRRRHRLLHPGRPLPAAAQRRHAAAGPPLPLPEARLRALLPGEGEAGSAIDCTSAGERGGRRERPDARPPTVCAGSPVASSKEMREPNIRSASRG